MCFGSIVGREKKLKESHRSYPRKKNILFDRRTGCGKTAIVEGLALRIVNEKFQESWLIKVIYWICCPGSSTKYRGSLKKEWKLSWMNWKRTVMWSCYWRIAYDSGSCEASGSLMPAIFSNQPLQGEYNVSELLRWMNTGLYWKRRRTWSSFRKYDRTPSVDETIQYSIINQVEGFTCKLYAEAIDLVVKSATVTVTDRMLPDKAMMYWMK